MTYIGNQQERLIDLGWLIGFLESEANVSISRSNKRKNGKVSLYPHIQATNSELVLVEKAARVFDDVLGTSVYIYHKKAKNGMTYHIVECGGIKRLAKVLPIIIPLMTGEKKEKAELVLSYVTRRLLNSHHTVPYSEQDFLDYEKLKKLNIKPSNR